MSDDRYINGTCPMTCPNFKRQSESIAEYQRIEKTLQATITELTTKNNDMWSELSIAHVKTIKDRRVETMQTTIVELTEKLHYKVISHMQADERITELTKALDTIADYDTDEGDVARAALKEQTIEPE